ncbi:hypothetical protein Tco_0711089, partial [Tanacetum coccineum]
MSERFNQDVKEPVPNRESMSGIDEKNVEESGPNKESMTRIDEKNVKESVSIPKKEVVSEPQWINIKKSVLPTRNVFPILDIMRGTEYTPDEYYYYVMKDANEVNQFVESLHGEAMDTVNRITPGEAMDTVNRITPGKLKMYGVADDPQAFYWIVVFGYPETRGPYGGYAVEIFLEDSFYDIYGIQTDFTGDSRKLVIPTKKSMASSLVKRVAYSLLRVSSVTSSSRLYNTKGGAVKNDKALYLQRIMTIDDDESAKESVPNKDCVRDLG